MAVEKRFSKVASLTDLNFDCILEVFRWLSLKDAMNLAETCNDMQDVADYVFKKTVTELEMDFGVDMKQALHQVGSYLTAITLVMDKCEITEKQFVEISERCKNVRSVTLIAFKRNLINPTAFFTNLSGLDNVTLTDSCLARDEDFFKPLTKLKSVNIKKCSERERLALIKCFEQNRNITSFTCTSLCASIVPMVPNLERLSMNFCPERALHINHIENFEHLRYLTMHSLEGNPCPILTILAERGILEELVIINVIATEQMFRVIKKFNKLKFLGIGKQIQCAPPEVLPPQLEVLKLGGFRFSKNTMSNMVKHHKRLKYINLENCFVYEGGCYCDYFKALASFTLVELMPYKDREIHVSIVSTDYSPPPVIITTAHDLWIRNFMEDFKMFEISYPGLDRVEFGFI